MKDLGIESNIVFHSLRACFATHMLASGVNQATVMKIGGWKDIKTFQIYVRLAGIDVRGATDALNVMPQVDSITGDRVLNMSNFVGGLDSFLQVMSISQYFFKILFLSVNQSKYMESFV